MCCSVRNVRVLWLYKTFVVFCLFCSIAIESAKIKDFTTKVPCHGFKACCSTPTFRLAKRLQWRMSLQTYPYANIHMLKQICSFSISRFHTYAQVTHVQQVATLHLCIFSCVSPCLFKVHRNFTDRQISFRLAQRLKKVKHSLLFFPTKDPRALLKASD